MDELSFSQFNISNASNIICPYHLLEERKRISDKNIIPGLNSKKKYRAHI